jgi:hypothetical protein
MKKKGDYVLSKMSIDDIKNQYIEAAILQHNNSINGDYKTANRNHDIITKIFDKILAGEIDKVILFDLLQNTNDIVVSWAATHMITLNYETQKAEMELKRIALSHKSNMLGFRVEMCLNRLKEQGYL